MNRDRRGYSLAELLVALVIAGIIGAALTRLVISQARFVATQDGMMRARSGARAALNVMTNEFRMVSDSGLVAASRDSVTIRVPYAFGVACQQSAGTTVVSLLPADSASYGSAAISGYAWRDSLGAYNFVEPATVASAGLGSCSGATPAITTLSATGWSATAVAVAPNVVATPVGAVVYLYQLVRYAFAASVELPGRRALWRTVLSTGVRDELVTPFDTSASFQFLVGSALAVQQSPPADLGTVRGLRVKLVAASEAPPEGRTAPVKFDLTTNLLFRNNAQ